MSAVNHLQSIKFCFCKTFFSNVFRIRVVVFLCCLTFQILHFFCLFTTSTMFLRCLIYISFLWYGRGLKCLQETQQKSTRWKKALFFEEWRITGLQLNPAVSSSPCIRIYRDSSSLQCTAAFDCIASLARNHFFTYSFNMILEWSHGKLKYM